MKKYRPADTGLDGFDDSLMSRQHCLVHCCLVLTELAIGREGAGDVTVIAIVLAPHVQQQHVIAPNLPVCKATFFCARKIYNLLKQYSLVLLMWKDISFPERYHFVL